MTFRLTDWPGVTADRLLWLDGDEPRHAVARAVQARHEEALQTVLAELRCHRSAAGLDASGSVGFSEAAHADAACALLTDRLLALGWEPARIVGAVRAGPPETIRWALVPCRPLAVEAARRRLAQRGIAFDAPPPPPALPAKPPVPVQGSLF